MAETIPMRGLPRVTSGAFDRALAIAAADDEDASNLADALSALQKIVSLRLHPAGSLRRVVEVARDRMTRADSAMVWQIAVDLALATEDRQLRAMVAQVAAGHLEPAFSSRQGLRLWVRSTAQRALNRVTRQ